MIKRPMSQVCLGWRCQEIQGKAYMKTLPYGQDVEVSNGNYAGVEFWGAERCVFLFSFLFF